MFSRGIDPDVCDPSQCHHHPEAPEIWPGKDEIINYVNEVIFQKVLVCYRHDFADWDSDVYFDIV